MIGLSFGIMRRFMYDVQKIHEFASVAKRDSIRCDISNVSPGNLVEGKGTKHIIEPYSRTRLVMLF